MSENTSEGRYWSTELQRWLYPEPDRVRRLQDAIEGECGGLKISEEHARAILEYVDGK